MRHALAALLLLFAARAGAADPIATVTMLIGSGTATATGGTVRALAKGDSVFVHELLDTGPNSYLNLRMTDGSLVLLRPMSRFTITEYSFAPLAPPGAAAAPDSPPSRVFMQLLRGGLRTVSGIIGKAEPESYRLLTPAATIGVRGTDYVAVLCDAACALDPVVAAALPPGQTSEGALLAGVVEGAIVLHGSDPKSGFELQQDQFALVLPGANVRSLPAEPHFLRVDPIPNPRSCQ